MGRNSAFVEFVLDMLAPLGGASARRMFGGYGFFSDGVMFGLVAGDTLYFKVGDGNRADFEKAAAPPFVYRRSGREIALSYREVPPDVMDDPELLSAWARRALDAARQAKGKAGKRKA